MADTEKKVVDEQTTEKKPRKKRTTSADKKTDTPAKATSDNKSAGKKSTAKKTTAKKVEPKEVDKETATPEKVETKKFDSPFSADFVEKLKEAKPKKVEPQKEEHKKVEEPKKVVKEEKSEVESKRILLTYPTPVYRAPGKQFYCEDAIGYAIFNGVVQNGFAQVKYGHDWKTGYIDVSVVGR